MAIKLLVILIVFGAALSLQDPDEGAQVGEVVPATKEDLTPWYVFTERQRVFCVQCLQLQYGRPMGILVLPHARPRKAPLICAPFPFAPGIHYNWIAMHYVVGEADDCSYHYRTRRYTVLNTHQFWTGDILLREYNNTEWKPTLMGKRMRTKLQVLPTETVAMDLDGFSNQVRPIIPLWIKESFGIVELTP